ncbi:MAG: AarF/ABC1/UbiB kinase family protein [Gammaproteobacteria bacterium]|jgi:predicted unusual protein kinase regulating ubiquinone biosynthesis (AarF/ABC1/UbiB family)|nr:AarF/ABC1/UbiB kinase family protein [Gammaproteobacteria bacterium]MBP6050841.1 AarF/ABC1/UbiB kinase family protein [Pseudomonadales bacterium]MBK7168389.1 AarF/ABC1/UbiB kinase family protein [Gammaproteobacteria bacterium]MBK7520831.1 AarF/ABC1/UbiB kinase family protein [Gammaproteobacteria bacterium]MBK7727924.1 AarF/ABC1/UbiB kinase family protein [Gammaproteobacteria bacterium]
MSDQRRKETAVPGGRLSRLGRMARLATGIAGGMLAEGGRQIARGNLPRASELLLTPANARRVAEQLASLRGAAMKLGQLLSMDAGDLLPAELSQILSRLRADAQAMPRSQLEGVLHKAWGKNWEKLFADFSWRPLAAASIGQVHRATTLDGRQLALKVQYPGVARSIDSDVNNVAALLRISRLLPESLDMRPLLDEAKRQLRAEADYLKEAAHLAKFAELLADDADFAVPVVHMDLSRREVLAMSYLPGKPLESMDVATQAVRDRIAELLFRLLFREMFDFRLVQTDPNFANYHYQEATGKIVLFDFGATRRYPRRIIDGYRKLFRGVLDGDRALILAGAGAIGYFPETIKARHREELLDLFVLATEPLGFRGSYDFAASDLPLRLREAGTVLSFEKGYWHNPPADAVFLHRKLGGIYLLAARLRAKVDLRRIIEQRI